MAEPAPPPGPQQMPATWDLIAPTYAEDVFQWQDYAKEAVRLVPVGSSERVLDIACGPGTLALLAAERGARVDAVDFSPGMVEQLRAKATRGGVTHIEAAVMDAQALSFPDGTFDAAFSLFAFFFFPDRARAFSEMHRVLRKGGRALVATWAPIDRRPVMKVAFDAMAEAMPQFPRPAKGDLQTVEECVQEMSQAGFRDVTAHVFSASMRFDSPEHYLDTMVRSGAPFAVMKQKMPAEAWTAMMTRLLDGVRKRLPEGPAELSAEAILTTGLRG